MGLAREIFQEGLRIPPVKILQAGCLNRDVRALLFANTRSPREREGDLTAQIAACRTGERRVLESVAKYGFAKVLAYCGHLLDYSDRMMRALLREIPDGTYRAVDYLDDDGISAKPVPIRVAIRIAGERAQVDFTGSAPQCQGSVNAVRAIAESAVMYVFRCLLDDMVPATSGLLRPFEVIAPEGTVVNARMPAAVAGGNVETPQRIVDTLLRALAKADPRPDPRRQPRHHEQFHLWRDRYPSRARRPALRLLRDDRRRHGCPPHPRRRQRHPHPYDQFAQYARSRSSNMPIPCAFTATPFAAVPGAKGDTTEGTESSGRSSCWWMRRWRCSPTAGKSVRMGCRGVASGKREKTLFARQMVENGQNSPRNAAFMRVLARSCASRRRVEVAGAKGHEYGVEGRLATKNGAERLLKKGTCGAQRQQRRPTR
jgi:hypothetical protein